MGHKAAEKTHNVNAFGPGDANKCTLQWWCRKFCEGDKSLDNEECSSQPSEADSDQWRAITEADCKLIPYLRSCPKAQCRPFYSRLALEANWKGKKPKWVPHEVTKNQKNCHFQVLSFLILFNNNKHFFDWTVT